MPKVEGLKDVQKALSKIIRAKIGLSDSQPSVIVGYTAKYALFVHENIEMKGQGLPRRGPKAKGNYWDPQGRAQAKFLEAPARQNRKVYAAIIVQAVKRGSTVLMALYLAGLRLQRDSMLLVPVDTGNLKASAFTMREN